MHPRPDQPLIEFDPQQSQYALALWHAVSGLLELVARPDGLETAVNVAVPGWAAAGCPWTLRRAHPTDLAFVVERHENGATIDELAFTGTDVDHVALHMLQFDRGRPTAAPAALFDAGQVAA